MRLAVLILCALALPAHAQSPPSKMLERAIRLYDKQDYLSASLELHKVLDQKVDSAQNLMRAEFFLAKTLYQMGFHGPAAAYVQRIQQAGPQHVYFNAIGKWAIAIIRVAENPTTRSLLAIYRDGAILDEPAMQNVRDEIAYHLARELFSADVPKDVPAAMLAQVSPKSAVAPRAQLELARLRFRAKDLVGAYAAATAAGRTQDLADDAARLIASWSHIHNSSSTARAPLEELARTNAYARYQLSRVVLDSKAEKLPGLANVSAEAFDAIVLPAACRAQWPDDIVPLASQMLRHAQPIVARLLTVEDNAEMYAHVAKLHADRSLPGAEVISLAFADPTMQERFAWLAELKREIELVNKLDKAWQTTMLAAEILQELVVVEAVEQADMGKQARQRLVLLDQELAQLQRALDSVAPGFAVPAGPKIDPGVGLSITNDLCTGKTSAAPTAIASSATAQPTTGCAGCTAGASPSWLFALAFVFIRRRRRV